MKNEFAVVREIAGQQVVIHRDTIDGEESLSARWRTRRHTFTTINHTFGTRKDADEAFEIGKRGELDEAIEAAIKQYAGF